MPFLSINPATGEVIRRHRRHTRVEIGLALEAVHRGQRSWRELSPAVRAQGLLALAAQLQQHQEELAQLVTAEMGKPIVQARREIEKCASTCRHFAERVEDYLRPARPEGAPSGAQVVYQPLGVMLAIMPWNFPFWQVFRAAVPALLAGNTLLLKHAANVAGCAFAIERLFRHADLPAGLLRTILAEPRAVAPLIADPRVRLVTVTGSTTAGKAIGALAGAALKPCVFELGGTDSYLVLEDADVAFAAETLATARLINSGQTCVSPKRLIVHHSIRAEFAERLAAAFRVPRLGDPTDAATGLGPLAREDLRQTLHRQVMRSVRAGAQVVMGGRIPRGDGFFYPPTVLTHVRPEMAASREELFGPVATVLEARDEEEAIAIANATPYGLGGGVFTRDLARGERIARERLDVGMAVVNACVRSDPHLPFGGTKESGYGRELGEDGIRGVVNVKTVTIARGPATVSAFGSSAAA